MQVVATRDPVSACHHIRGLDWQLRDRFDMSLGRGHTVTSLSCGTLAMYSPGEVRRVGTAASAGMGVEEGVATSEFVLVSSYIEAASAKLVRSETGDAALAPEWEPKESTASAAADMDGLVTVMKPVWAVRWRVLAAPC